MEKGNRPHSRDKKVESGSASVGKGNRVDTGSRPVGSGGRPGAGAPREGSGTQNSRPLGGIIPQTGNTSNTTATRRSGRSSLLLIILAIVAIFFISRSGLFGGGGGNVDIDQSGGQQYGSEIGNSGGNNYNGGTTITPNTGTEQDQGGADLTVSSRAREKRVVPLGGGRDTVTVMIYMCGTDLESKYGMATSDLNEMLKATISDKVNVIVETGGCKSWKNSVISSSVNQIYKVENGGVRVLEQDIGTASMTDPENLTDFIKYCKKNYPADRNMLIFWDHGGGSLSGYGYDEKRGGGSMTLAKIDSALKNADCVFDAIGFDTCLMATLETALVCNNYADYLIASEETEPGTGWHYTGWLTELSKNTSIPTVELSKLIIDDFVEASLAAARNSQVTLSVVDLAELQGTVPDAFRSFAVSTNELLQGDDYQRVSNARAGARQFARSSKINQVDLVDLAQRIGTKESNALAQALKGCIKYNKTNISNSYGISIYFPYESLSSMNGAVSEYKSLGMDAEYTKCIQSFASLGYGGQIAASSSQYPSSGGGAGDLLGTLLGAYGSTSSGSSSSASPLGALLGSFTNSSGAASSGSSIGAGDILSLLSAFSGRSMPAGYGWVDTELVASSAGKIASNYIDPGRITVTSKNGRNVLALSEEEWALIQTVELNVFVDDGEGYIDLGLDNTFEWAGDDLLLEYDGTWLTVNGKTAAYYLVSDTENSDGSWTTVGRIPALLNGELVNLCVVFDGANPDGAITGAYPLYSNGETETQAKGNIAIEQGDVIEFLCDYYDYDGSWSDSYTLGASITVGADGLRLANRRIEADSVSVTYRLTDIYGNSYWTPAIEY